MIEDFRQGYPRFCALIEADPAFHLFRRFSRLRARLILRKQHQLSLLEQRLESVDKLESFSLFLASNTLDQNAERRSVLDEIETVLQDYDDLIERNRRILNYRNASCRDISSLRNWVVGNACLARDDSAYLGHKDLFSLAEHDGAIARIGGLVEDFMIRYCTRGYKHYCNEQSRDPHVYFPGGIWIGLLARIIIAIAVAIALLVPILICNYVEGLKARVVIVAIATIVFITTLVITVQVRTIEVVVAGTTYATVLIGFVSGSASSL